MVQKGTCQFLVLCYVLWCTEIVTSKQCLSRQPSSVKLSIVSRRNETGNWIAQVSLDHGAGKEEGGPYLLDVDHSTVSCESGKSVLLVTTMAVPQQPGFSRSAGYSLLPGLGYYKFHDIKPSWYEATQICVREGGHMLVLNSDEEFAALKQTWDQVGTSGEFLHIGINSFDKDGDFVTVFGKPLNTTGYIKWKSGEPNSGNTARCGAVSRSGLFEDSYCSNKLPFFCEQSL